MNEPRQLGQRQTRTGVFRQWDNGKVEIDRVRLAGCGKMGSEIAKRAMLSVYPGLLASLVGVEGV